jgi:hypothetical protein
MNRVTNVNNTNFITYVGGQAGRYKGIFAKRTHLKNEKSPTKSD